MNRLRQIGACIAALAVLTAIPRYISGDETTSGLSDASHFSTSVVDSGAAEPEESDTSTATNVTDDNDNDYDTNYYTNVDGDNVESPDKDTSGATAQCNDGSFSHSLHRTGTCPAHGGVSNWL